MFDITIIGAGPAGITAAIYAARKKMKTAVITKDIGGQAAWSGDIKNYTGFQFVSGPELAAKFEEHLKTFDIELMDNTEAICVDKHDDVFKVKLPDKEIETKTVIMATGRQPRMLGIPGEKEYKNKGVTYCATCDGPLFSGKDVAVVGGGNSALDAVLQLIPIANKIYLINDQDKLIADEVMIRKAEASDKIEIINNANSREITGEQFVKQIKIVANRPDNQKEERTLDVQGIFIEIGSVPVKSVAECQNVKLNDYNEIKVNEKCETNIPGFFGAGDVTNVPEKQIIVAAGQGCIACLSAFKYISKKNY